MAKVKSVLDGRRQHFFHIFKNLGIIFYTYGPKKSAPPNYREWLYLQKNKVESCLFCTVVKNLFFYQKKCKKKFWKFLEMFFFFIAKRNFHFKALFWFFCTFFDLQTWLTVFFWEVFSSFMKKAIYGEEIK